MLSNSVEMCKTLQLEYLRLFMHHQIYIPASLFPNRGNINIHVIHNVPVMGIRQANGMQNTQTQQEMICICKLYERLNGQLDTCCLFCSLHL